VGEGDWIGLTRQGIVAVANSPFEAARGVLEKIISEGHEVVTVIEGSGATPAETRRLTEWLAESRPGVAVELHHGGQPLYPYLLSAE
jgi:dihydroxyacetone kinase-like predicted kinase